MGNGPLDAQLPASQAKGWKIGNRMSGWSSRIRTRRRKEVSARTWPCNANCQAEGLRNYGHPLPIPSSVQELQVLSRTNRIWTLEFECFHTQLSIPSIEVNLFNDRYYPSWICSLIDNRENSSRRYRSSRLRVEIFVIKYDTFFRR